MQTLIPKKSKVTVLPLSAEPGAEQNRQLFIPKIDTRAFQRTVHERSGSVIDDLQVVRVVAVGKPDLTFWLEGNLLCIGDGSAKPVWLDVHTTVHNLGTSASNISDPHLLTRSGRKEPPRNWMNRAKEDRPYQKAATFTFDNGRIAPAVQVHWSNGGVAIDSYASVA